MNDYEESGSKEVPFLWDRADNFLRNLNLRIQDAGNILDEEPYLAAKELSRIKLELHAFRMSKIYAQSPNKQQLEKGPIADIEDDMRKLRYRAYIQIGEPPRFNRTLEQRIDLIDIVLEDMQAHDEGGFSAAICLGDILSVYIPRIKLLEEYKEREHEFRIYDRVTKLKEKAEAMQRENYYNALEEIGSGQAA